MPLFEIRPDAFDVELALAYATPRNVTGAPIYRRSGAYLHAAARPLFERAIELAATLGYRLKVFDAFRPAEAQWRLWEAVPNAEFLADPRRGSPHSRGVAIDLTLIDRSGVELDMGTAFDDFSPLAHHGAAAVSPQALRHRSLLLGLMTAAGWDCYLKEWWHYQMFDPRRFPLLSDSAAGTGLMT
ncbi:MAG: D-alanyl-D-alanine dipeptidase [Alphaproteobacteria bacterium]|nr:D-alanyl-D-alanine dipeptidase [Alphaproteobacteria bacterium]